MAHTKGLTHSVWMDEISGLSQGRIGRDMVCDVCVVGGGIAGLTTAYLLAQEGRSVVLLEKDLLASGQTERTTAHLSNRIDEGLVAVEQVFGLGGLRHAVQSHSAAIDFIEKLCADNTLHCDFERVDGYLFPGSNATSVNLDKELGAARHAGIVGTEYVARAPLGKFNTGPALRFPNQAQIHPTKYMAGVAKLAKLAGVNIYSHTSVVDVSNNSPQAVVKTNHGFKVTAGSVVVATNSPIHCRQTLHTKQSSYTTYVIGAAIPKGSVAPALYWDTDDPYHYVRVVPSRGDGTLLGTEVSTYDILLIGGEDHKTGHHPEGFSPFDHLEIWARERFDIDHVAYRWSGQVMETLDGLAYIGHNPGQNLSSRSGKNENVYLITGDSGMGMTHGTLGAILIRDLIVGRENPWQEIYNPARVKLATAKEFLRKNIKVAGDYFDWVKPGVVSSVGDIAVGEGGVVRAGIKPVAVYRDSSGMTHEMSAVCTHLGGIVHWNATEKSWDCPCHGSRFDAMGSVISGPANADLHPVNKGFGNGKPAAFAHHPEVKTPFQKPTAIPAPLEDLPETSGF